MICGVCFVSTREVQRKPYIIYIRRARASVIINPMFPGLDFQVAIPSYRRAGILRERTLALLVRWRMPMDRVYVFCTQDDTDAYRSMLATMEKAKGIHLVEGPVGLHHMRNFIQAYFPTGAPVLHMDDDLRDILSMKEDVTVEDIRRSSRYRLSPVAEGHAVEWIGHCFEACRSMGASLWGIYPVRNGFFMKDLPEVTTDLRFCVGTFWGVWNDQGLEPLRLEEKEDFERTLLAFTRDGAVVRFNRYCAHTHYYTTPGGMQARGTDRVMESRASCSYLMQRWPEHCRLYKGKKNGIWEVRLRTG